MAIKAQVWARQEAVHLTRATQFWRRSSRRMYLSKPSLLHKISPPTRVAETTNSTFTWLETCLLVSKREHTLAWFVLTKVGHQILFMLAQMRSPVGKIRISTYLMNKCRVQVENRTWQRPHTKVKRTLIWKLHYNNENKVMLLLLTMFR